MPATKARIRLMIYDGARKPFSKRQKLTLRIHSGETIDSITRTLNLKSAAEGVAFLNVDYFDNFADNYTVVLSADGYRDTGFYPVKVSPKVLADLSLMLIPTNPKFEFDSLLHPPHPTQSSVIIGAVARRSTPRRLAHNCFSLVRSAE